MGFKTTISLATLLLILLVGCATAKSKWRSEGPPNQTVQIKEVEYIGKNNDFTNAQIGIANSVIGSFTTVGPTDRDTPLKHLPAPSLRIKGAQISHFSQDINIKIQEAININADPTTISHETWQVIKSKYPSLTHLAVTIFDVYEKYKLSEEAHNLPYIWSSTVVCRTIIIDLNTLNAIAEWRQEFADRSTWTDACAAPEELIRYLVQVGDTIQ